MPAAGLREPEVEEMVKQGVWKGPDWVRFYNVGSERGCHYLGSARIYTKIGEAMTIGDRRLVQFLFDLCERFQVPCQRNVGGGTDAAAIQQSRAGALSTTIGAPVRYMHSTVQLCHADDIEATAELLAKFLEHAHELLPDER